jgi:hypothetical protein
MAQREKELKIIQGVYREWVKTNPNWENEQSASVEDELKLIFLYYPYMLQFDPFVLCHHCS